MFLPKILHINMTHKLLIEFVHCEFNAGTNQQKKRSKTAKKIYVHYIKYIKFCRAQKTENRTRRKIHSRTENFQ